MNQPTGTVHCQVKGADRLPAEVSSPEAWCAPIEEALAAVSPKPASVEVEVQSPHLAAATVTLAGGRSLPAINVGRSDRPLGQRSVQMLADSIAAQVAAQQSD